MNITLETILEKLPDYQASIQEVKEILLANAVMFGEIPAPTFEEEDRGRFLLDRFNEAACQSICTDESGNAIAMLPGTAGKKNILVGAHMDTPFSSDVEHTVTVHQDRLEGPGILDNSLGLAAVASLPAILEKLGIELKDNLILLGSAKSLGSGDIGGMRFFAENNRSPIRSAVLVEGGTLGRLSYGSLGMLRSVVRCNVPDDYDHNRYGNGGAIPILHKVIQRMLEIPIPQEPQTNIILGGIRGGTAFNTAATHAELRFEVRSEQVGLVAELGKQISSIVDEIGFSTGADVSLETVAQRQNVSIAYNHPLVATSREIMASLDIKPRIAPSTGEIEALIKKDIPTVTLGLTKGSKRHELNESAKIEELWRGLTNVIGLLVAIDGGICDDEA